MRATHLQEAEEGEGEGEEGEGGEKEPPPPPPAPKVDPYEFKERDVVYLDLPDLPAEVGVGVRRGSELGTVYLGAVRGHGGGATGPVHRDFGRHAPGPPLMRQPGEIEGVGQDASTVGAQCIAA